MFDSLDILISVEVSQILKNVRFNKKIDMGEGFVLMNLSKYKRWRALLYRVTVRQQSKREQIYPVCLHAVEK